MLHLEPRVHLEERRLPATIQQELARPGAGVGDSTTQGEGHLAQSLSKLGIDGRGGRLLEHFLVPALDGTVALAEVDPVSRAIEQHLDLDMTCADDQPLEDEPVVREGDRGFAPG